MAVIIDMILIMILIICMITDFLNRKIYNKVIFPSIGLALLLNSYFFGIEGIKIFGTGFIAGFGIFFIPFILNWIGAGDLKLVAVVGGFKGLYFLLYASLIIAVIGALVSLIYVIKDKQFKATMTKIFNFLTWIFVHKKNLSSYSKKMETSTIPYGVAIGVGAIITIVAEKVMII